MDAVLIIGNISSRISNYIDWNAISIVADFKKVPVFKHVIMVNAIGNAHCVFFYTCTLRADQKTLKK